MIVVILAGGKSSRMGRDKLMLTLDGETFLQSAVHRFSAAFPQVLVSVADMDKYPEYGARRVVDIYPGLGPISGLHAALSIKDPDGVFIIAADLPFSRPDAAKRLIELGQGFDACVIERPDGRIEPLFAYYGTGLLPLCERAIAEGEYRMARLLGGADARRVSPTELGGLWSEELLRNVNYPADYEKIQKPEPRT